MSRKNRLYNGLIALERAGIIRSLAVQSNMPGVRWTIEAIGWRGTRCYSTSEAEAFLHGAEAVLSSSPGFHSVATKYGTPEDLPGTFEEGPIVEAIRNDTPLILEEVDRRNDTPLIPEYHKCSICRQSGHKSADCPGYVPGVHNPPTDS